MDMRALWMAAALLLCGADGFGLDVLHMKNGDSISGVILKETESEVELRTLFFGEGHQIVGTATAVFPKADLKSIDRMAVVERRRAIARSEAFNGRGLRLREALRKIEPIKVRFMGKIGFKTVGRRFEVTSTCDERFVCEVTHYIEEMFAAYEQDFEIGVAKSKKIQVYVLADMEEYKRFQRFRSGYVIENPAYYDTRENYIAAYNMVEKQKAAEVRKKILEAEKAIRAEKAKLDDHQDETHDQTRQYRKRIHQQAARARKRIQNDGRGNNAARLREVEESLSRALRGLARWKKERLAAYEKVKDLADAIIRQNRRVIIRNNGVIALQNKAMFQTMFHEGFHAFARNFLWTGRKAMLMTRWLNEGLAVYYEGSAVEAGYLIHGGPHEHHLQAIRKAMDTGKLIPIDELLTGGGAQFMVAEGGENKQAGLYYAQSWLLAHYMTDHVPRRKMQTYVHQVEAGMPTRQAFESMMGMSVKRVAAELRAHASKLK
ncbi:MAG: gluzincin family metallopeptidase [Planctomycetota bacterium]|jgi:hypothetical protein